MMRGLVHINAEEFRELGGGDNNCCGIGEAINYRMGKKINHHAETEHAEGELKKSNH